MSHGTSDGGAQGLLRTATLIAVLASAGASVCLMLHARGPHASPLLLVIMGTWVIAPFIALQLVDAVSKRWSVLTRTHVSGVRLVVALGSLAVYGDDALGHRTAQAAFVYVVVPLASWLLLAIVVWVAALRSGWQSRQDRHSSE